MDDFFAEDFRADDVFAEEDFRAPLRVVLFFRAVVLPAPDELFRAAPRFAPLRLVLLLVPLLAVFAELPRLLLPLLVPVLLPVLLLLLLLLALFRPPVVALLRDADLRRGAAADFEVLLREPVRRELLRDDFLAAMLYSGTRLDAFT